jgi:hypothetical protein
MTDIVFIVDGIEPDGTLITVYDKIKSISNNWQENLFSKHKSIYYESMGDRVKFIPYSDIKEFDPTVAYFYFVPMNDWHCTAQIVFNMLSRDMQNRFAENGVAFYFCQDLEMYPNQDVNFFANYLGWLHLCKHAHSRIEIPVYFAMASKIVPRYLKPLKDVFKESIRFVNSPVLVEFSLHELKNRHGDLRALSAAIREEYMRTNKQKMYMSLTRDTKYHRMTMLHGLRYSGLLDDGFVSNLLARDYNSNSVRSNSVYSRRVRADMQNILPTMTLDDPVLVWDTSMEAGITGVFPTQFMAMSCYDLVQETATNYEGHEAVIDMAVITEKTVKSLLFGRPFMINGGQHCLSVLHSWGFKTYPMLFDESYDTHEDFVDRQEIIVSNVNQWKGRHTEFMSRIAQPDVQAVLSHNVERLLSFPIEELLIKEIASA